MTVKFNILFLVFLFSLMSCVTNNTGRIDYARMIRNTTFSDVHRNPKVVGSEYFEFKGTTFSYSLARKSFKDSYFQRSAYQGIYVILENIIFLTVQKMLFCDKEVMGQNESSKPSENDDPEVENKCTYSYYDIELLRSRRLIDDHTFEMPTKFKIVKAANSTTIVALNGTKGKVYEDKKPLNY